ncbi:MAG: SPOR domain-containing protein [Myxococcales bacterium]
MARLLAFLAVTLCALPAHAADAEVSKPDGVVKWVAERAASAAAGKPEIVRFPLAHRGTWGSGFPTYFIADNAGSGPEPCPCLAPKWAPGAEEPNTLDETGRDAGRMAVVEGRFTGKSTKVKEHEDEPDSATHTLWEFEVLRWRPFREGGADETKARVVASSTQAAEVTALSDERPWLATVDSFPALEKSGQEKARQLLEKAVKAGFSKAEVLDSRGARLLFCCYKVVVAGRFATQDEATALMKELKQKGFANAGVRRGW